MSWLLLLKYRSCPAPSSPVHVSGWWGRAWPAAGRKAGVFAGTRAQAQRWGSSGIHHGRVPSREGPEGRPQRSGGGHSASPCTPWISGHSPAGKQQLSRDGPAATSPSPCSPPGPRTPRGSASRGSSGPGGVRNHSRSTAPCPEPLQLLGSPPSAVLLAAMPPLLCLALTNSGVSPKRAGVPHSGTRPQTRPH